MPARASAARELIGSYTKGGEKHKTPRPVPYRERYRLVGSPLTSSTQLLPELSHSSFTIGRVAASR